MIKRALFYFVSLVPYSLGSYLIDAIAARPTAQRTLFRDSLRTMSMCSKLLPGDQTLRAMVRRHVVSSGVDPWRIRKLGLMNDDEYHRWVSIINGGLIKSLQVEGKSVLIATCHIGMARFLPLAMAREGIDVIVLEGDSYYQKLNLPGADTLKSIEMRSAKGFYLKAMFQAKKVLNNVGVLLMAPDGLHGMGEGNICPFLGKERTFYAGFAGLAAMTGAVVIWVNFTTSDDGRIEIKFVKSNPVNSDSQEEVVADLMSQYVSFVEGVWKKDIANVKQRHLVNFLSL